MYFTRKYKKYFLTLFFLIYYICLFAQTVDKDPLPIDDEVEISTVTIESAQKTEYKKENSTGDEIIYFIGNVSLSVVRGKTHISIQAEKVNYNRKRATLFAEGDITFSQQQGGAPSEKLTASSLLFNTETLEGVFDNGRVVQESSGTINLPNGTKLVVFSELFGRENSGTVTFKNGTLTFCDDKNPHWKIKASRIWLLPGNEFSFFNAVLYVGQLPIMYFPFFYYPKDELIFNPVFGYNQRTGYFTQTTTYLIGRKGLTSQSADDDGIFSFMKTTELKKQRREGLFLHNLDEKDIIGENTLKLIADYYTTLGGLIGTEGVFKPKNIITDCSFSAYIGFSNTIFLSGSEYSLYSPTGKKYTDFSYFFGAKIPFRYYASLKLSLKKDPVNLVLSVPFYSDAYFKSDFLDRKESMDWINFMLRNPVLVADDTSSTSSSLSSYSWTLSGSFSKLEFVDKLKPYLNDLSISSISSAVNFSLKTDNSALESEVKNVSPLRSFFYPSSIYPLKVSTRIGGTLFSTTKASSTSSKTTKVTSNDLVKPENLTQIKEKEAESTTDIKDTKKEAPLENESLEKNSNLDLSMLPNIAIDSPKIQTLDKFSYTLNYTINPDISTEMNYDSSSFLSQQDIDFSKTKSSFILVKAPVSLKSDASIGSSFLKMSNSLSFTPVYQDHPTISPDFYPDNSSTLISLRKTDYGARKLDLGNNNSFSIQPFNSNSVLANTSVSWDSTLKIINTSFTGTVEEPKWDYKLLDWDEESITSHKLTMTIAAKEGLFSQKFSLSANLPPQVDSYYGSLELGFPFFTITGNSTYKKISTESNEWEFLPFSQTANLTLFDKKLTLSQSYKYNIKDGYHDSLEISATAFGVSLRYGMSYTYPYKLDEKKGWIAETEKKFLPVAVTITYSTSNLNFKTWKNRISITPSLNTALKMDLIRGSNSYFSFIPTLKVNINDFFDLTFSSESRNEVIFRYIQDLIGFTPKIPGETNVFIDLFNSFAFWSEDQALRKASGFKLKKLTITLNHDLHDWILSSEFSVSPRLITTTYPYTISFDPLFKLSVVWRPLSSMKTTIQDKYGEFLLNPD